MKDALRAARLDADVDVPHRIVDLVTLEQQIRRFLANIGGKKDMVLPPCDKATRAKIHELAQAFSLKSQSKGKGQSRYTTLTKSTKSGLNINEKKVNRIMRQVSRDWAGPRSDRGGKGNAVSLNKHREGEEVGKVRTCLKTDKLSLTDPYRLRQRLESLISGSRCLLRWDGLKENVLVCQEVLMRLSQRS